MKPAKRGNNSQLQKNKRIKVSVSRVGGSSSGRRKKKKKKSKKKKCKLCFLQPVTSGTGGTTASGGNTASGANSSTGQGGNTASGANASTASTGDKHLWICYFSFYCFIIATDTKPMQFKFVFVFKKKCHSEKSLQNEKKMIISDNMKCVKHLNI